MESPAADGDQRKSWRTCDFVMIAAGAILLLCGIGGFSFGNDEAVYARVTSGTWAKLAAWLRDDNYPPLYFAFLTCASATSWNSI